VIIYDWWLLPDWSDLCRSLLYYYNSFFIITIVSLYISIFSYGTFSPLWKSRETMHERAEATSKSVGILINRFLLQVLFFILISWSARSRQPGRDQYSTYVLCWDGVSGSYYVTRAGHALQLGIDVWNLIRPSPLPTSLARIRKKNYGTGFTLLLRLCWGSIW